MPTDFYPTPPELVSRDANARRPAEWQPPDDGRLYTLVACSGCGNGYPLRYLAHLEDGRYLCRSCFDVWMEDEQ